MFKLARIYHQEGDAARARELLQRVVNEYQGSDSPAPRLAREYLQQNF
jgi:TolA-binding protein